MPARHSPPKPAVRPDYLAFGRPDFSEEEIAAVTRVLRSGWVADYDDPISFLGLFTKDSAQNFTGWSDPAYDRALYEAARTPDRAARHALLRDAETRLLEAAPILPLYINTHVYLLHPSVQGWHPTLLDRHPLKAVSLNP